MKWFSLIASVPMSWKIEIRNYFSGTEDTCTSCTPTIPQPKASLLSDMSVKAAYKILVRPLVKAPTSQKSLEKLLCRQDLDWASIYTILQNKRMRRCGVPPPPPPPIIFERLKLPQQIIYRRRGNLSESPNHQKYWENILVSRFYEQFSRNRRNLGHFRKFEKISNSYNMNILCIISIQSSK